MSIDTKNLLIPQDDGGHLGSRGATSSVAMREDAPLALVLADAQIRIDRVLHVIYTLSQYGMDEANTMHHLHGMLDEARQLMTRALAMSSVAGGSKK